eukprot:14591098-Alexandrium_andersonii.AAC.1
MATVKAKQQEVEGAMGAILTMENEFEVFLRARYPNLWKFTRMKAYDCVVQERIEASANLFQKDSYLRDETLAAAMVRDFQGRRPR